MTSEILRPILITTPHYSIGFPSEQIESYISRDAYIAHIYDFIQNGTDILFLEGEEGAGKTAILAQYAT
ncbi:MAG: hypothetical protein KA821_17165, partial [Chitinophagaceae bacterium]|nr:hypothetical protein [Chitinophagaceae bacterium]